jgi:sugar phosphate isomerase/epimerase
MELGLYFAVLNHMELKPALELAADLGYSCLELSAHTGARFDVENMLKSKEGLKIAGLIKSYNLRISAINMSWDSQLVLGPHHADTDVVFKGSREEKIKYGTDRMIMAAQLANRLEIPVITGFTGCEDYSRWFPWPDPNAWESMEPVFVERWSVILKQFDELGVLFGMECHPKQMVYNTETALRSLELLGHFKSWNFNFDPANLMLAGVDPVVFIAELGPRIVNVHMKDGETVEHQVKRSGLLANGPWNRPDRGFRFRVPGWGDIQWRKIITELSLQGYHGVLTVEHEDPTMAPVDGIKKAFDFLKPLLIEEPFTKQWW